MKREFIVVNSVQLIFKGFIVEARPNKVDRFCENDESFDRAEKLEILE